MCKPVSTQSTQSTQLKQETRKHPKLNNDDKWIESFDLRAFTADIKKLGKDLLKNQGKEDVQHLDKMILWGNTMGMMGCLSMGFGVSFLSAFCISCATFVRWTMIAHHTCHGGYDKCHPDKGRFNKFKFAIGSLITRFFDWFDWMLPEAWNIEHNNRHHYCLGEIHDPDLVEENAVLLRNPDLPYVLKYSAVVFNIMFWKWYYYAPNTYKELKLSYLRKAGVKLPPHVRPERPMTFESVMMGQCYFYSAWEFIQRVVGPYFLYHFFILPLPWLLVGSYLGREDMYTNAVKNLFLAEVVTNIHSFIAIVTNHAGDDMYRFRHGCKPYSGSFFLRQVISSVDFQTGNNPCDFMHGFLNYQVEHHLWPNLSMRSYQKAQPLVKLLCKKHGVPYIQQNVWARVKKTVDIMVGNTSMREFPESYELLFLEIDELERSTNKTIAREEKELLAMDDHH